MKIHLEYNRNLILVYLSTYQLPINSFVKMRSFASTRNLWIGAGLCFISAFCVKQLIWMKIQGQVNHNGNEIICLFIVFVI
jgi:hypothetical protein